MEAPRREITERLESFIGVVPFGVDDDFGTSEPEQADDPEDALPVDGAPVFLNLDPTCETVGDVDERAGRASMEPTLVDDDEFT